jgi:CBS domain containing-hemolysin-like protein
MGLLLSFFFLAIFASFLCSILEAVLLSLTPSFISASKSSGSRSSRMMDRLRRDVDRPLSAILSLNTIAHTVGAAGVGAQAQVVFSSVPFSVISGILTLLILVLSEIIPKTLGATYWRPLAVPSIYAIHYLTLLFTPFVALSSVISSLLTKGRNRASITRDEIHAMADLGRTEGVIDPTDARMLQSVMRFQNVKVDDIFTPRPVVRSFPYRSTIRQVLDSAREMNYSRYPVLGDGEKILGYALRSEILMAAANDEWDRTIEEFTHKAKIIPEQMPVKRAMSLFLRDRTHMAMVVDEFGSFAGVLTLEDVVETLIGYEIVDEGDEVEDLRKMAREMTHNTPDPEHRESPQNTPAVQPSQSGD